jgi:hypothetical protein
MKHQARENFPKTCLAALTMKKTYILVVMQEQ